MDKGTGFTETTVNSYSWSTQSMTNIRSNLRADTIALLDDAMTDDYQIASWGISSSSAANQNYSAIGMDQFASYSVGSGLPTHYG